MSLCPLCQTRSSLSLIVNHAWVRCINNKFWNTHKVKLKKNHACDYVITSAIVPAPAFHSTVLHDWDERPAEDLYTRQRCSPLPRHTVRVPSSLHDLPSDSTGAFSSKVCLSPDCCLIPGLFSVDWGTEKAPAVGGLWLVAAVMQERWDTRRLCVFVSYICAISPVSTCFHSESCAWKFKYLREKFSKEPWVRVIPLTPDNPKCWQTGGSLYIFISRVGHINCFNPFGG